MTSLIGPITNPAPHTFASAKAASANTPDSDSSSADASGSNITADDFLTLLVAELKNQDPTQPSDPTQFVQQLVGVNSLQQLIGINQGVADLDDSISPTSGS